MSHPDSPTPFDPSSAEAVVSPQTPGAPSDGSTLTEVLGTLGRQGFDRQFVALDGAIVECTNCDQRFDATAMDVAWIRRLEGASDPDDMLTVVAAHCPNCGVGGTILLGYGVNASAADADISAVLASAEVSAREVPPTMAADDDLEPNEPG